MKNIREQGYYESIIDSLHEHIGSEGANFKGISKEIKVSKDSCVLEIEVEYPDGVFEAKALEIKNINSDDIKFIELE